MSQVEPLFAQIRVDSAFAGAFPGDQCPVTSPVPEFGRFGGLGTEPFYRVPFARVDVEVRRIAAHRIAQQCSSTTDEVLAAWEYSGWMPLRARHVLAVQIDGRLF